LAWAEDDPGLRQTEGAQGIPRPCVVHGLGVTPGLARMSKVFEISVDPTSRGRPLEAGGAGGGKPLWMAEFAVAPPGTGCKGDETPETIQSGSRCGIPRARHLLGTLQVDDRLPCRGRRKRARESGEGETVLGLAHCQVAESVHYLPREEAGRFLKPLGVQGVPTNVVAKRLELLASESKPPRGDCAIDPGAQTPSYHEVIPAREDQTAPTGCPDLLKWRRYAAAMPRRACLFRGARGSATL
jgi:hypothetical protein